MTKEEALKVAEILVEADSCCKSCAGALCREFVKWKPEFEEQVSIAWKKFFDSEWKEDK